ncbi:MULTISPECIES: class I SAM-dependent methyltransferase [Kitasatospora]|uniref:Class I SAM-dependent methyltransferase n=1 Tax=Kitasatospora acidiphila TaxID=2567942 RepID=A0A540W3Q6_9ACTN|nr:MULTISPECIES: class I SAM-dependent methyltransferase [Kitasatospora]MDH6143990.1 ubiquinone/menaquinone biosynthesis C-methylase UbiE [Kitasatospora sp. GP30]TQF03655.1 class I SAM-dependent methyltransferase [Kitasatospora acidiphila]
MSDHGHPADAGLRGRVRRSYDTVAEEYQRRIGGELADKPLDRALLAALLEQAEPGAPLADLGCGPGHVTGWLADRGAEAVGVDLSPGMVALARGTHPQAEFRVGDLCRLPAADGEFGAAVMFYSVIHLTAAELPTAFAELHRVLRPGGRALLAFHLGNETRRLTDWWGHRVDVDFTFFEAAPVTDELHRAGFTVEARVERDPYPAEAETRRAYLLARRD